MFAAISGLVDAGGVAAGTRGATRCVGQGHVRTASADGRDMQRDPWNRDSLEPQRDSVEPQRKELWVTTWLMVDLICFDVPKKNDTLCWYRANYSIKFTISLHFNHGVYVTYMYINLVVV